MSGGRPKRNTKLGIVRAVIAATKRGSDCWRLDIHSRKAQDALYRAAESPSDADDRAARMFRLHRSKGHTVTLAAELATFIANERGA